jgi:Icc-related predicted phosphoesterase
VIRVAAVGDLHVGADALNMWRQALQHVGEDADLLLLAGDLTRSGTVEEAAALLSVLRGVTVPIAAVFGNHDFHCDQHEQIAAMLERRGVAVLEGAGAVFDTPGGRVAVAGTKGFGGGFEGACGSEFGEPEMKAFIGHTRKLAGRLGSVLGVLAGDVRIALLHYAPIPATLAGERLEIHPFLGSYLLGEAIDRAGADLVVHGHAHAGSAKGATPAGIPVRNVAYPVIQRPYTVFCFGEHALVRCAPARAEATA